MKKKEQQPGDMRQEITITFVLLFPTWMRAESLSPIASPMWTMSPEMRVVSEPVETVSKKPISCRISALKYSRRTRVSCRCDDIM